MITEEKKLMNRCGKANPFVVPEGYFDSLTSRVMANIPSEEAKVVSIAPVKRTYLVRWTSIAAACIVGTFVSVNIFNNRTTSADSSQLLSSNTTAVEYEEIYDEEYQQEVINYAMVDYNDVYNYMAGSSY